MLVYIDAEYGCHTEDGEGRRAFDIPFFAGKCAGLVEGYRYVPEGESWTREDGEVFNGEMIAPLKDSAALADYYEQYDAMLPELEDMKKALEKMGVSDIG